jgi:hypothetical protein
VNTKQIFLLVTFWKLVLKFVFSMFASHEYTRINVYFVNFGKECYIDLVYPDATHGSVS